MRYQCAMTTGTVIERRMVRVAPPKHPFAQTRVAVAAHDEKVAVAIGGVGQECIADVDVVAFQTLNVNLNAVSRQMQRDIGARQFTVGIPSFARMEGDDVDSLRLYEERHGVLHCARRLTAGVSRRSSAWRQNLASSQ